MAEGTPAKKPKWFPTLDQKAELETMFARNQSPNPKERTEIANRLHKYGDVEDINIGNWFRNRRTKRKKEEKKAAVMKQRQKKKREAAIKKQRQKEEREAAINQFVQQPSRAEEILPTLQQSAIVKPEGDATTSHNDVITALRLFTGEPARANPQPDNDDITALRLFTGEPARASPQPVQETRQILPTQQTSASVMPEHELLRIGKVTTVDRDTINSGNLSELRTLELFPLHPGMPRDKSATGKEVEKKSQI